MNSLMQQERRLYPRYSVDMTLDVDIDGNAEEPAFVARACNLSQNGISIICSDPEKVFVVEGLSYSDECVLHFALTEDEEAQVEKVHRYFGNHSSRRIWDCQIKQTERQLKSSIGSHREL